MFLCIFSPKFLNLWNKVQLSGYLSFLIWFRVQPWLFHSYELMWLSMVHCHNDFLFCGGYRLSVSVLFTNFVIIIHALFIFTCSVKISLALPVISNFIPVSYLGYVEQHVAPKNCCTWWGYVAKICRRSRVSATCRQHFQLRRPHSLSLAPTAMATGGVVNVNTGAIGKVRMTSYYGEGYHQHSCA